MAVDRLIIEPYSYREELIEVDRLNYLDVCFLPPGHRVSGEVHSRTHNARQALTNLGHL